MESKKSKNQNWVRLFRPALAIGFFYQGFPLDVGCYHGKLTLKETALKHNMELTPIDKLVEEF